MKPKCSYETPLEALRADIQAWEEHISVRGNLRSVVTRNTDRCEVPNERSCTESIQQTQHDMRTFCISGCAL